jgi:hypoxanthine-guanine phosphoribosyltransferase
MERKLYLSNNSIVALTRWLAHKINAELPHIFNYRFPVTLVGIAEGGIPFTRLLSSFLEMPHEITYLRRGADGSFDLPYGMPSQQAILADCIYDTGKTFIEAGSLLCSKEVLTQGVVLLQRRRNSDLGLWYPQYSGFTVSGREFFIGFGLDDREGKNRELSDIYSEGEIES